MSNIGSTNHITPLCSHANVYHFFTNGFGKKKKSTTKRAQSFEFKGCEKSRPGRGTFSKSVVAIKGFILKTRLPCMVFD